MQPGNDPSPGGETFVEAARRDQIVAAAIETIAEEGYAKASFVRIAERASISPGLITYHFKTKERLIRRILGDIDTRLDRAMEGGEEPLEGFEDGLRRIITGHIGYCARNPREMTARREITAAATLPERLRGEIAEAERAGRAELVGFLTEGRRHGEFRAFDPEVFTDTMFAAMHRAPAVLRERPSASPEDYARELADLFCAAATGRPPEHRTDG
ncbi:TetR/AcrR family transcriptional regulator [Nocardiopsis lambiniae]|uniref:TetR/AcrR family transcriptional regulator n=1 Tax=Nocardiopsis lambiniae TaxID=3075539 RepID=A0ABU2MEM1_9ACTN|nr:TetR/AcrR family transcriptional regulator [Nocardiopsis sp. DSM 44743]MDT0331148.1 TetR/AcrR family transcriptional regulator [Nocardiopsis sp. DSM 44743]